MDDAERRARWWNVIRRRKAWGKNNHGLNPTGLALVACRPSLHLLSCEPQRWATRRGRPRRMQRVPLRVPNSAPPPHP